jgi:tRNA1(Val) A37 N6-methylase TrmN6
MIELEDHRQTDLTDDAFLGGALRVLQPRTGYRAGIDAVLLAAAVPAETAARLLDAGAGVGTAGLCAARRCPSLAAILFEREPVLVEFARENILRNGLGGRVTAVMGDLADARAAQLESLGLAAESFDHVLANPPFHVEGDGTKAAAPLKAGAHEMAQGALEQWIRFLARMAKPGGTASVIHKAEALSSLLGAFAGRFGGLRILPIHARAGEPAIRVIVQGMKGSRAPLALLSPFILHGADGGFGAEAQAILREGAQLRMAG